MANEYLIEIHNFVSKQIDIAKNRQSGAEKAKDKASQRFYDGQLAEWHWIRTYLAEKVDLKTQKYF